MTDRDGQTYDVVWDGRGPLLPPRDSGAHPLSVLSQRHGVGRNGILTLDQTREAQRYREAQHRRDVARAACRRAEQA